MGQIDQIFDRTSILLTEKTLQPREKRERKERVPRGKKEASAKPLEELVSFPKPRASGSAI